MTFRENLEFPLRMSGVDRSQWKGRIDEVLERVQLGERKLPSGALDGKPNTRAMSGGEMQRLAIAKMLLRDPEVLLFDEAFANLDLYLRQSLRETVVQDVVRRKDKKHCAVFVSHNVESAIEADRILFFDNHKHGQPVQVYLYVKDSAGSAWEYLCNSRQCKLIQELVHVTQKIGRVWSGMPWRLNAFGVAVPTLAEMLNYEPAKPYLRSALVGVFRELGLHGERATELGNELWKRVGTSGDVEAEMKQLLLREGINSESFSSGFLRRTERIAAEVRAYCKGDSLLDVGCGDGKVAWSLRDLFTRVALTDVVPYVDSGVEIPFTLFKEGEFLPFADKFDTVLLLTVLHHAQDPLQLLREVRKVTQKRCIIIESLFGVDAGQKEPLSPLRQMAPEAQWKYAAFIDWLYNRVFRDGVPVPYNYNTPDGWNRVFRMTGWKVVEEVDLGVDQPIAPEHHYLFVVEPI